MNPVAAYIEGLKKALGVERDEDLATKIGVGKSTIASWRRRGVIAKSSIDNLEILTGVRFAPYQKEFYSAEKAIKILVNTVFYRVVMKLSSVVQADESLAFARALALKDDKIREVIKGRILENVAGPIGYDEIIIKMLRADQWPDRYLTVDELRRVLLLEDGQE